MDQIKVDLLQLFVRLNFLDELFYLLLAGAIQSSEKKAENNSLAF